MPTLNQLIDFISGEDLSLLDTTDVQTITKELDDHVRSGLKPIVLKLSHLQSIIKECADRKLDLHYLIWWAFAVLGTNGIEYDLTDRDKIAEIVYLIDQLDGASEEERDQILQNEILPLSKAQQ